jgi:hypothetical protein
MRNFCLKQSFPMHPVVDAARWVNTGLEHFIGAAMANRSSYTVWSIVTPMPTKGLLFFMALVAFPTKKSIQERFVIVLDAQWSQIVFLINFHE